MKIITIVVLGGCLISGCAFDYPNGSEGTPGGPGTINPHCVARVSSSGVSSSDVSCYSTFRDAIAFATGGVIVDAPEANVALTDESFARRLEELGITANPTIVIGIDFTDIRWQGSTFTWTADRLCDGNWSNRDFFVSSMPSGWNDVISSFRTYVNCLTVLHEHINFGGATLTGIDVSFGGSAMDNAASSIEWF